MNKKIVIENDARVVSPRSLEGQLLVMLFILIYCAYAALGRDVFFNQLYLPIGALPHDPIGLILPYLRFALCFLAILIIFSTTGLGWALSKVAWMFAPFCILAMLSAAWSADPKNTLRAAATMSIACVALSMIVHRVGMLQCVRASIHLIAAVCIISTFLAIFFPHIGRHDGLEVVQSVHAGRWRGIFSHKNGLGPWAAYGSLFLFTHSWLCKGPKLYWWTARISALCCLVFSGSATGVVLFFAILMVYIFFQLLRRFSLQTVLFVAFLCLSVMAVLYSSLSGIIFEILGRDETLSGRAEIWATAREYFWVHPWVGNGFNQLGGPLFQQREAILFDQAIAGPESSYYTMLLDLGILGSLAFLIPYFISIRNGIEWMKHVTLENRAALEFFVIILISELVNGYSESSVMLATGFDGILGFTAFFALMTTPKSPQGVLRGEFRLAKHRLQTNIQKT